jgi:hypothetical protein
MVLASVGPEERIIIFEDSKPKNGIDKVGKKVGVLKEKYQLFFQAVCEIVEIDAKSYNFKKSKELQYNLSTYIHSYHLLNENLNYESTDMQQAIKIINETQTFIKASLMISGDYGSVVGMELSSLPEPDKQILEEWKNSTKMSYDDLKNKLMNNHVK